MNNAWIACAIWDAFMGAIGVFIGYNLRRRK